MSAQVERALELADIAQQAWAEEVPRYRLHKVGRIAGRIAACCDDLVAAIERPNASDAEKLASEVIPLADACRFTARIGRRTLASRSVSYWYAAWWMGRISVRTIREPWGTVLILGPTNYPLLLPGVQAIQAIAAGNSVVVKPAPGGAAVINVLKRLMVDVDIPKDLLQILPATVEAGEEAMRRGVDKVVLTGSAQTGKAVLRVLGETLTPATLELSGCDAMFVLPEANLELVAKALHFALTLNGGATCIAPRRIFVPKSSAAKFMEVVKSQFAEHDLTRTYRVPPEASKTALRCIQQAIDLGAKLVLGKVPISDSTSMGPVILEQVTVDMDIAQSDIFAPVASIMLVEDMADAMALDGRCPYSLGASIFGPQSFAEHWAKQLSAGCVVINDVIAPTADPRVPFGGRRQSGWGVTRGEEGLREMTTMKAICTRHGKWLPHLDPQQSNDPAMLANLLQLFHARGFSARWSALQAIVSDGRKSK